MKHYEEDLRGLARQVVDAVRGQTEFDFVTMVARELPMLMLGKMLGVPLDDGPLLVKMGDALIGNTDPEFTDFRTRRRAQILASLSLIFLVPVLLNIPVSGGLTTKSETASIS